MRSEQVNCCSATLVPSSFGTFRTGTVGMSAGTSFVFIPSYPLLSLPLAVISTSFVFCNSS